MVTFSNPNDVKQWLSDKPRAASVVIITRAALRVIPLLTFALGPRGGRVAKISRSTILPALRHTAAAWVAAASPTHAAKVVFPPSYSAKKGFAAGAAAFAAFNAYFAYSPGSDRLGTFIAGVISDATKAVDAAHGVADFYNAVSADATELAGEFMGTHAAFRPIDLAIQALWPTETPPWANEHWTRLKSALLKEHNDWWVWTDWYEARLTGGPIDPAIEFARATIEWHLWNDGARKVNGEIAQIISRGGPHPDVKIDPYEQIARIIDEAQPPERPTFEPTAKSRPRARSKERKTADTVAASVPRPVDNVPSPIGFGLSSTGTVVVTISPTNLPVFPRPRTERDYANRIEVCRVLAQELLSRLDPKRPRYQAREMYREQLDNYLARLPTGPGEGNILLADAAMRILRSLFQAEATELSYEFASELKVMLEHHIGLRAYYPGVEEFYNDVRSGRLEAPLPLDAVEGIADGIMKFTPRVFDPSVSDEIAGSATPEPQISPPQVPAPVDASQPQPPPDPLGELDPNKSHNFRQAGIINALWKAVLDGEKVNKALEGWQHASATLAPHVSRVLDWLHSFLPPS